MAKPLRAQLRELGRVMNGIPAAAAAPVPPGSRIRRRRVGAVLGLGALMSMAGGVDPRRPDQVLDASSAGIAPGTSTGILRARELIASGTGLTGVLVYSGAPQLGTLVDSMTNGAAATDGAPGNAVIGGVVCYQPGTPAFATQLSAGKIQWWNGPGSGGPWTANGPSLSQANGLALSSGTLGGGTAAVLSLSNESPAGVGVLSGSFGLAEEAVPSNVLTLGAPQLFGASSSGMVRMVSDLSGGHGDGQAYDVAENTYFNTAAVNIPASGFTTVFSQPVGSANGSITYSFSGKMRLKQGAAGSIPGNIGFTGPTTSFGLWDAFWRLQGASTTFESADTLSFATQLNVLGVQTVAGDEVTVYFDGTVTFTTNGTFILGCQADGTHPFTAQPGCKLRLRPVG